MTKAVTKDSVAKKEDAETIAATGRRKTAVAQVRMVPGSGEWKVNRKGVSEYFCSEALVKYLEQPSQLTHTRDKYDICAKVSGGGLAGQAGALRHGIARALALADTSFREVLKNSGCLTRDSRMKERKKPGQPGARKRFQFSKR